MTICDDIKLDASIAVRQRISTGQFVCFVDDMNITIITFETIAKLFTRQKRSSKSFGNESVEEKQFKQKRYFNHTPF